MNVKELKEILSKQNSEDIVISCIDWQVNQRYIFYNIKGINTGDYKEDGWSNHVPR